MQPLILIVDDNPGDQLRIRVTLERKGYCVLATTADEAESVLKIVSPALVLFDVEDRGDDALALARSLRRAADGRSIQLLAMTLDPELGGRMAAKAGCVGYISKPLDLRNLGDRVAEFIG